MRKRTRTCGSLLKWSRDPHSPCEWAGPSDSLLWIEQGAKWWNVTSKTRLQEDYGFWWAPYLLLFLSGKLAAMLRVAYGETHVARSRCPQPTASEVLEGCRQPRKWVRRRVLSLLSLEMTAVPLTTWLQPCEWSWDKGTQKSAPRFLIHRNFEIINMFWG